MEPREKIALLSILSEGMTDHVSLRELKRVANEFNQADNLDDVKRETIRIVEYLVRGGWMIAGEYDHENGEIDDYRFTAWSASPEEVISRVRSEWDDIDRELFPTEIVVFVTSEKGTKLLHDYSIFPKGGRREPI